MSKTQNVREQESVSPPQHASEAKKTASAGKPKDARATVKSVVPPSKQNPQKPVVPKPTVPQNVARTRKQETSRPKGRNETAESEGSYTATGDIWGAHQGFRNEILQAPLEYCFHISPDQTVNRVRLVRYLSNGLPGSLVNSTLFSLQTSVLRDRHLWPMSENSIFYLEHLYGLFGDVYVLDAEALLGREEEEFLADAFHKSPTLPAIVCDPESRFARGLPPAFLHSFPTTQKEMGELISTVFFGAPPIETLARHLVDVLEQSSGPTCPLEFVERLKHLQPELYLNALRSLRGCNSPNEVLAWKLLDILGELPLTQQLFHIPINGLPLAQYMERPLLRRENAGKGKV